MRSGWEEMGRRIGGLTFVRHSARRSAVRKEVGEGRASVGCVPDPAGLADGVGDSDGDRLGCDDGCGGEAADGGAGGGGRSGLPSRGCLRDDRAIGFIAGRRRGDGWSG